MEEEHAPRDQPVGGESEGREIAGQHQPARRIGRVDVQSVPHAALQSELHEVPSLRGRALPPHAAPDGPAAPAM
eukprot:3784595-Alexandrium_andersonii.AAC.1